MAQKDKFYRWWQPHSTPEHTIVCDMDIRIPLRDGIRVSADVYRPAATDKGERFPVVLIRSPFRRRYSAATAKMRQPAKYLSECGLVVVTMDARGRGNSEGTFVANENDGSDGYDGVEWCAAQPWSNGKIGLFGGSLGARSAWLTALTHPPHLVTMISKSALPDPFVSWPTGTQGPIALAWHYFFSSRDLPPSIEEERWAGAFQHLPLVSMDETIGIVSPSWREELQHTCFDDYWRRICYQDKFAQIDLPVLHVGGWYDDSIGTVLNFAGMRQHGHAHQQLLMGPWDHKAEPTRRLGALEFGAAAVLDLYAYYMRWFDHWLKELPTSIMDEPPAHIFVMGANTWRGEADWPLPRTQWTNFYLHSAGGANTRFGDGTLATLLPGDEPVDSYIYDPAHPVPFLIDRQNLQLGGPDDYAAIEERDDMLVYTSAPLIEDLEMTGPITATLYAASSGVDTDFMVKLLDVWPDGFAQRLCDGAVRARFRESIAHPSLIQPQHVYEYMIRCGCSSHVFEAGHAIRLEITSSGLPKYDRNLNRGESIAHGTTMTPVRQTIYHESAYPSHVCLPLMLAPS